MSLLNCMKKADTAVERRRRGRAVHAKSFFLQEFMLLDYEAASVAWKIDVAQHCGEREDATGPGLKVSHVKPGFVAAIEKKIAGPDNGSLYTEDDWNNEATIDKYPYHLSKVGAFTASVVYTPPRDTPQSTVCTVTEMEEC